MKKNIIKKIAMAVSASIILSVSGICASAATEAEVVAAAKAAGFLNIYVQQLSNYLRINKFTPSQYDKMLEALDNVESIGDEVAIKYFGRTIAEMRGQTGNSSGNDSSDNSTGNGSSGNSSAGGTESNSDKNTSGGSDTENDNSGTTSQGTADTGSNSWAKDIVDKMSGQQMLDSFKYLIDTGKELGLDISVEQTGNKSFIVTVRDEDGNVQMVTPVGIKDKIKTEDDGKAAQIDIPVIKPAEIKSIKSTDESSMGYIVLLAVLTLVAAGAGTIYVVKKNKSADKKEVQE